MDKQELRQLVSEGLSQSEIATRTGRSKSNVAFWLKKHKLKTKIARYNAGGKANKTQAWRRQHNCPDCGEKDPKKFYKRPNRNTKYIRCKTCHNRTESERFREYKRQAVAYKGGKCQRCGYSRCAAALEFHHEDPAQKDRDLSRRMRNQKLENIKQELDKCMLVCRNCHAEIHYG